MTNTKLWQCRKVHQVYNIIEPCYNTGQVHYSDPDCNSLLPIRADNSKIMYSVTCRIHSRLGQGCCWQHWSWPTWPCPTKRPQTDPLHLSCRPTTRCTRMNKNEQDWTRMNKKIETRLVLNKFHDFETELSDLTKDLNSIDGSGEL